jgi:hypothetical protein
MADKEAKGVVKAYLRERKVKLWEPPHTYENERQTCHQHCALPFACVLVAMQMATAQSRQSY